MAKADRSNILSPFQRFEKLAKALFAIPKKEADKAEPHRKRPKQRSAKRA